MGVVKGAARQAGGRYKRMVGWVAQPVRGVQKEAHDLHEVERTGESAETPFIAMLGLVLFLGSVFLVMVGLAFAAYYLAK